MSRIFDRLAQANAMRETVEAVNRTRRELGERPQPERVDVVTQLLALRDYDGEGFRTDVHAAVRPELVPACGGICVTVPAGYTAEGLREAFDLMAAEYARRYDELHRAAEAAAAQVLGEHSEVDQVFPDPDLAQIPF